MKKSTLPLIISITLTQLVAFAQGRISFQTDSLHLAYYDSAFGDGLDGAGVDNAHVPTGVSAMMADLYMGTSSGSLSLYATTSFSATPGKWATVSVKADGVTTYNTASAGPAVPGGTQVYVLVQVRDNTAPAEATLTGAQIQSPFAVAAANGFNYIGFSQEFTFTLGTSSISYPFMYTTASWSAGTFNMDQYGAGSRGAIDVNWIPEPSVSALAGLAVAAGLILRRHYL